MSPIFFFFNLNIPNHGLIITIFQGALRKLRRFGVFCGKTQEMSTFFGKTHRYGYPFFEKLTRNIGMGVELPATHANLSILPGFLFTLHIFAYNFNSCTRQQKYLHFTLGLAVSAFNPLCSMLLNLSPTISIIHIKLIRYCLICTVQYRLPTDHTHLSSPCIPPIGYNLYLNNVFFFKKEMPFLSDTVATVPNTWSQIHLYLFKKEQETNTHGYQKLLFANFDEIHRRKCFSIGFIFIFTLKPCFYSIFLFVARGTGVHWTTSILIPFPLLMESINVKRNPSLNPLCIP